MRRRVVASGDVAAALATVEPPFGGYRRTMLALLRYLELARLDNVAWVLRDEPGWTHERIRAAMNGPETIDVKLGHSIPVFVLYGTALVAEDGEVRFFDDVYGADAALARALAQETARRSTCGR